MRTLWLTLLSLIIVPSVSTANPLDAFGLGARSISMGGAFTSIADDSSANYYNPAGLAQGDDLRFDLGYLYSEPTMRFNGADANVDLAKGMQAGVVLPGDILGTHFGIGIGMYLLDDRITRVRALPQQQPRFVLFDNRLQRLYISANFAVEPIEHLFIGGGLTFFAGTTGTLDVTGSVSLVDSERTELQASINVDIESDRYPQFGILYAPDAPWSVGLVYRHEFFLRLNLGTHVTGQILLDTDPEAPVVLVEEGKFFMDSANANLYSPRQLVLGGSYDFGPVTVSADIGWYMWSGFQAPASELALELELGTLDFSIPEPDPIQAPNFVDLVIPRIGVEATVLDTEYVGMDMRLGYFFEDTPAPDQPGITNYADSAKHGISCGMGLRFSDFSSVFPKPILLDMSFLYVHMTDRTYIKDDASDLIGDYLIDGYALSASVLLGVLF